MHMSKESAVSRMKRVAICVLFALVAAACGGDSADDASVNSESDAAAQGETPTSEAEPSVAAEDDPSPPDDPDVVAAHSLPESGPVGPGTYETDVLGTPITFTTASDSVVEFNEPGLVIVGSTDKQSPVTESVAFFRATGFASAEEAVDGPAGPALSGNPTNLGAWIDATGGVTVVSETEIEVGGETVVETTFSLDPAVDTGLPGGCGPTPSDRCYMFVTNTSGSVAEIITRTSEIYRVWILDDRSSPPLVAMAFAVEDNAGFFDSFASPIVESVILGEPAGPPEIEAPASLEGGGAVDQAFVPLGTGEWTHETLGIPMSFTTVDDSWVVQPNEPAFFVLSHPDSFGPGDKDIVFIRVDGLSDPATLNQAIDDIGPWPVDDIAGWIDNLPDGIEVANVEGVTIGGREATRFDLSVADDFPCGPQICAAFVAAFGQTGKDLTPGIQFRVWYVDGGDHAPLAIIVGSGQDDPDAHLAAADELLATIEFGEPEPHPVGDTPLWELGLPGDVPAGEVQLPTLGGISFELTEDRFLVPATDTTVIMPFDGPGEVNIGFNAESVNGPIETTDDIIAVLEQVGGTLTEADPIEIAGYQARVFDLVDADPPDFAAGPLMFGGEGGWFPPKFGRFILFDSERGPIMIGAESFEDDSFLAQAIELQDQLATTLEFIELD